VNPDDRALALAARIADGSGIEWPAAAGSPVDADERALLDELKAIAEIATVHRTPGDWPTETAALAGTRWGPLTLLAKIGEGRFGCVYAAWDARLQRRVALKLLHTASPTASASPTSAIEEARLLARVRHPNVLAVYGAEAVDGQVGIWTELIEGRTLESLLAARGPLPPEDVVAIGLDLCRALTAVHEAGLLHRDIKAQNVMRETGGRIVLMDFGTGHDLDQVPPRDGDLSGTPLYLAPELFAGGPPSVASDLYALAVLLFYLSTGRHPVPGRTLDEVRAAHQEGRPVRPDAALVDRPDSLSVAIERGLAVAPAARYDSARAFEAALERVRSACADVGPSTQATPRRHQYSIAVVVIVVAIMVGSLVATSVLSRPAVPGNGSAFRGSNGLTQHRLDFQNFLLAGPPSHDGRMLPGSTDAGHFIILDPRTGARRVAADEVIPLAALSPDGRLAAYEWDEGGSAATQIRLLDVGAMTSRQIYRSAVRIRPVGWMPDGSRLLVRRSIAATDELAWLDLPAGTLTPLVTLGGVPHTVTLSPDGRTVAFDLTTPPAGGQSDVFLLDLVTRHRSPLVEAPSQDQYPVWTTDGSAVVFVSDRGGSPGLWKQAVTRGQPVDAPVLIVPSPGIVQPVGFDDSGVLYYILSPQLAFWTADIDLRHGGVSQPTVVPVSVRGDNTHVDWSPDETKIVYTTRRSVPSAGLAIHDLASGAEQFFPIGPVDPPRWSPDGRSVVFASSSNGIGVLTVADGRVTVVPGGPFNRPLPAWSADGRFILFLDRTKGAASVCQIDPTSGRRQVLVTIGGNLGDLRGYRVSNHGDRIVLTTEEQSTGQLVYSVWDAATHTVREWVRPPKDVEMAVAGWSPDDQEIIMIRRTPQGDVELLAYAANRSSPRSLGWLRVHGDDLITGVDLSPTGARLRFTMGPIHKTTWAIEGFLGTAKPAGR